MGADTRNPRRRSFYRRSTEEVAVDLLGCTLRVRKHGQVLAGRIVETEAYLDARDLASHAAWSRRGRDAMERNVGLVYMYRSYGIHMMFNIVAKAPGARGAVLVRALEPVAGVETMVRRRGVTDIRNVASGPGKLCQALGLDLSDHLADLVTGDEISIEPGTAPQLILNSVRIGITKSADLPLRFFDGESEHVSSSRRGVVWKPEAHRAGCHVQFP